FADCKPGGDSWSGCGPPALPFVFTRRRVILMCPYARARHRWQGQELDSCQLLALFGIEGWQNEEVVVVGFGCSCSFEHGLPVFVYERQQHGPIAVENLCGSQDRVRPDHPWTKHDQRTGIPGFDPFSHANVRILTYLDVISRFLPNNSIQKTDLPEPVRACLEAKDSCQAFELDLTVTQSKRYGNLFLDIFAFHRKTRETGWNFK